MANMYIIIIIADADGHKSIYDQFLFNISHSGDYCVLASESDITKLGIDIMKIEISGGMQRINDFFRIMNRQFSLQEWDFIRVPKTNLSKLARFIRLWSLKESLVKAEGSGIVFPLSKISFTCNTDLTSPQSIIISDTTVAIDGDNINEWQFEELMIDEMHYVSVAKTKINSKDKNNNYETNDIIYQFKLLTIDDLLTDYNMLDHLFTYDDEKYWTDFCKKS